MKRFYSIITILFSLVSVAQNAHKNVSSEDFKKGITTKNVVVIDLRTPEEITKKGKIAKAVEINWFDKLSEEVIKKLDKSKTYYVYCAGGGRSGECSELMVANGFKNVVNLEKGFDDWKKKGFEVEYKK